MMFNQPLLLARSRRGLVLAIAALTVVDAASLGFYSWLWRLDDDVAQIWCMVLAVSQTGLAALWLGLGRGMLMLRAGVAVGIAALWGIAFRTIVHPPRPRLRDQDWGPTDEPRLWFGWFLGWTLALAVCFALARLAATVVRSRRTPTPSPRRLQWSLARIFDFSGAIAILLAAAQYLPQQMTIGVSWRQDAPFLLTWVVLFACMVGLAFSRLCFRVQLGLASLAILLAFLFLRRCMLNPWSIVALCALVPGICFFLLATVVRRWIKRHQTSTPSPPTAGN